MTRRFSPGQRFEVGGLNFRVERGEKPARVPGEIDLRLDVYNGTRWVPVTMTTGFMLADFFHENEEVLYPPPQFKGGAKYLSECRGAARDGWEHTANRLRLERKYKQAGLFGEVET